MIRILVVLAILGLAYMYFADGADKKGESMKPEEQYHQQEQKVQQMEQQAVQQLQTIDAQTQKQPPEN